MATVFPVSLSNLSGLHLNGFEDYSIQIAMVPMDVVGNEILRQQILKDPRGKKI